MYIFRNTWFLLSLSLSLSLFLLLILLSRLYREAHRHYLCAEISLSSAQCSPIFAFAFATRGSKLLTAHSNASTGIFSLVSSLESHCFPFTNLLHLFKAFECHNIKHILNIYNSPWYNILDWHPHRDAILLLTRQKWS